MVLVNFFLLSPALTSLNPNYKIIDLEFLIMNLLKSTKTQLAVAVIAAAGFAQTSHAAIAYSENFEALDQTGQFALALTGWQRYTSAWLGNVGTGLLVLGLAEFWCRFVPKRLGCFSIFLKKTRRRD